VEFRRARAPHTREMACVRKCGLSAFTGKKNWWIWTWIDWENLILGSRSYVDVKWSRSLRRGEEMRKEEMKRSLLSKFKTNYLVTSVTRW